MLEHTTINGRPALVMYLDSNFEPVDEVNAELVRVNFTDAEGGSMFLKPAPEQSTEDKNPYHVEKGEKGGQFTTGPGVTSLEKTGIKVKVAGRTVTIVKSKADKNNPLVVIDVAKFDAMFAKERDFYIGPGGTGNTIRDRYKRFQEFLQSNNRIEASTISVREDGRVDFINGRHRYAVMRDLGVARMPVVMTPESIEHAERLGLLVKPKSKQEPKKEPVETPFQVRARNNADPEFTASINQVMADIAKKHPELVRRANITDVDVFNDTSEYDGSNGNKAIPRDVNALYDGGTRPPQLAAFRSSMEAYAKIEPGVMEYIMLHELGHAYDRMGGTISSKPDFQQAMAVDHRDYLLKLNREEEYQNFVFLFYKRKEVLADTVAHILGPKLGGGKDPSKRLWSVAHDRFAKVFPNVIAYMRKRFEVDGIS